MPSKKSELSRFSTEQLIEELQNREPVGVAVWGPHLVAFVKPDLAAMERDFPKAHVVTWKRGLKKRLSSPS